MQLKVIASGSSGNCYILSDGSEQLLLDCGCPYRQILQGLDYDISKIKGVVITHNHVDHIYSAKYFVKIMIPVYGNSEVCETVPGIKKVNELTKFTIGKYTLMPFPVPHTSMDRDNGILRQCMNFGYLISHETYGKMLYATDFEYIKYSFIMQALRAVLIECNHDGMNVSGYNRKHVIEGHAALETTDSFLKHNQTENLKNVILCHISQDNATPNMMRSVIQNSLGENVTVNLAQPGLVVQL